MMFIDENIVLAYYIIPNCRDSCTKRVYYNIIKPRSAPKVLVVLLQTYSANRQVVLLQRNSANGSKLLQLIISLYISETFSTYLGTHSATVWK